jgi:ABC-2 type transport system permease protein
VLRSILLKTLRDQRRSALIWGVSLAMLVALASVAWANAYPDEADRARLAADIAGSLSAGQAFYGEPVNVDEHGGFIAWRILGLYPVLLGIFVVLAATAATRGLEERGEVDVVLAAGPGRARQFTERALGVALALGFACTLVFAGLMFAGPAAGEPALSAGRSAGASLNLWLAALMFGALGLLTAQLSGSRRTAAMVAGVLLIAAHLWANLGLVLESIEPLRPLSPLYLYGLSTPLADGEISAAGMGGMLAIAVAVSAGAGRLFTLRDIGATTQLPVRITSSRAGGTGSLRLLGGIFQRGVRGVLGQAAAWGVCLGAYAALIAAITPTVRGALADEEQVNDLIGHLDRGTLAADAGFLSIGLFTLLPALVALFAVTLASSWASDEREGRLEMELAAPLARSRLFVARAGAALAAIAVAVAIAGAAFAVTTALAGVEVSSERQALAMVVLVPLGGTVVAAGYGLAAWRPGIAAAGAGLLVAGSFFLDLLAPLFDLPSATRVVSVFYLAGHPIVEGAEVAGPIGLVAATAMLVAVGSWLFARRDIEH